jgi:hypothetical protein
MKIAENSHITQSINNRLLTEENKAFAQKVWRYGRAATTGYRLWPTAKDAYVTYHELTRSTIAMNYDPHYIPFNPDYIQSNMHQGFVSWVSKSAELKLSSLEAQEIRDQQLSSISATKWDDNRLMWKQKLEIAKIVRSHDPSRIKYIDSITHVIKNCKR